MTTRDYIKAAKAMVNMGDKTGGARRYLQLIKRERILRKAVSEGTAVARSSNPLSELAFTPPLSIAGCSQAVQQKGMDLLDFAIPVALNLQPDGKHRGTTLDDLVESLRCRDIHVDELGAMELYRDFMTAFPKCPRRRRTARHYARCRVIRRRLEPSIDAAIERFGTTRFTITVLGSEFIPVLQMGWAPDVILSCSSKGGFRIDRQECRVSAFCGSGLASVSRADLDTIVQSNPDILSFEFHHDKWVVSTWASDDDGGTHFGPFEFRYRQTEEV